jgi:hypothetical protein
MTSIRSFIQKLSKKKGEIIIVSGLPRSGTSMMMSALKAGGLPLLIDGQRKPDPSNPRGYFEFEPVKKLPTGGADWLLSAHGKAVKVISALLGDLLEDFHYKVIFMERNIDEVLASQRQMLIRAGKNEADPISEEVLREEFLSHLEAVKDWLDAQGWIEVLYISYNDVLCRPDQVFQTVNAFLAGSLDVGAMAQVVDPTLYREQKKTDNEGFL